MVRIKDAFKSTRRRKKKQPLDTEQVLYTPPPSQKEEGGNNAENSNDNKTKKYSLPKVLTSPESKSKVANTIPTVRKNKNSRAERSINKSDNFYKRLSEDKIESISAEILKSSQKKSQPIETVETDSMKADPLKEIQRRIYGPSLKFLQEVYLRQQKNEVFTMKDIVPIIEDLLIQLKEISTDMCMEWILSTPHKVGGSYLYTHAVNVTLMAIVIGKSLGFSEKELYHLAMGALLHDVGMLDMGMITKEGPLDDKEFDIIQTHPGKGNRYLKKIKGLPQDVLDIVWQHHEKANGKGYPQGLKRDKINNFAKVVRLIDSYEAMTHWRPWRKPFLPDEAIKMILDEEKTSFEVSIMKAFLKNFSIYPVGSWVTLSTKEICKVKEINPDSILRPLVEIIYDSEGLKSEVTKFLNLSDHSLIFIEKSCLPKEEE